ncbi:hypothetical protein ACU686_21315 [Yinghuangia aomiensis]
MRDLLADGGCDLALLYDARGRRRRRLAALTWLPPMRDRCRRGIRWRASGRCRCWPWRTTRSSCWTCRTTGTYFASVSRRAGITPRVRFRSRNPELVRALVAAGQGYAVLNERPATEPHLRRRPRRVPGPDRRPAALPLMLAQACGVRPTRGGRLPRGGVPRVVPTSDAADPDALTRGGVPRTASVDGAHPESDPDHTIIRGAASRFGACPLSLGMTASLAPSATPYTVVPTGSDAASAGRHLAWLLAEWRRRSIACGWPPSPRMAHSGAGGGRARRSPARADPGGVPRPGPGPRRGRGAAGGRAVRSGPAVPDRGRAGGVGLGGGRVRSRAARLSARGRGLRSR